MEMSKSSLNKLRYVLQANISENKNKVINISNYRNRSVRHLNGVLDYNSLRCSLPLFCLFNRKQDLDTRIIGFKHQGLTYTQS